MLLLLSAWLSAWLSVPAAAVQPLSCSQAGGVGLTPDEARVQRVGVETTIEATKPALEFPAPGQVPIRVSLTQTSACHLYLHIVDGSYSWHTPYPSGKFEDFLDSKGGSISRRPALDKELITLKLGDKTLETDSAELFSLFTGAAKPAYLRSGEISVINSGWGGLFLVGRDKSIVSLAQPVMPERVDRAWIRYDLRQFGYADLIVFYEFDRPSHTLTANVWEAVPGAP